jgi:hypothetical protein
MKQFTIDGITYKQVQKRTAERMYEEGKDIYLLGNKANPYSPWIQFNLINICNDDALNLDFATKAEISLLQYNVNKFMFYLPRELGTYANYYIAE